MPKNSDKIPAPGPDILQPISEPQEVAGSGKVSEGSPARGLNKRRPGLKGLFSSRPPAAFLDRPLVCLLPIYLLGLLSGWRAGPSGDSATLIAALLLALTALFIRRFQPEAGGVSGIAARPSPSAKHRRFGDVLPRFGLGFALLLAASVFFLGWGLGARSLRPPEDPAHIFNQLEEIGERQIILGGQVAEGSIGRPGRNFRLLIDAKEIILPGVDGPESAQEVFGLVRIGLGAEKLDVEIGDYVRLPVVLRLLRGFKNPGGFDYERFWAVQGVRVGGFVKSPALVTSWPGSGGRLSAWRSKALDFIRQESPTPAVGILAAQLAGRRAAVDSQSEDVFRSLGLSHILSVSGLHMSVCYGFAFWLLRLFLGRLARLSSRFGYLKINVLAAALALVPALFYAGLAGSASPVLRAALTIFFIVLASIIIRRSDPWNILAAAAWLILLFEPYRLFTASFQLSFVATAAMLAVFVRQPGLAAIEEKSPAGFWSRPVNLELLVEIKDRIKNGRPSEEQGSQTELEKPARSHGGRQSFFRKTLLAALAGSLGTAPLVAWHFTWLPLAGIPANLILTPILTVFVLMPGLLALFLLPISPALAAWPMKFAGTVMSGLLPIMEKAAELAGPGLPLPAPGPLFLIGFYLAGWVWLRGTAPWRRRIPLAVIILTAAALPGLVNGQGQKNLLRVTVLDVGQGSAVHVNLPDGRQMLIDGGGASHFDPGQQLITPYLSHQGLSRLDVAALTHPDLDHLKGLVFIAKHFKPEEIWDAPWPENWSPLYREFLESSPQSRRADLAELYEGRRFGPAEVRLIWPPPGFSWDQKPGGDNWVNDSGLVFQIRWGSSAFLITGDISQKSEKQLVELYGRDLASTVLVAPHHGSRTSLSPEFLEAVGADYIVFSAGRNNYAGLPHPETVERALAGGATIWRTDQSGAAVFEVGKDNNKVELIEWRN